MSLRQNTLIEITQMPNDVYPSGRNNVFTLDFVEYGEVVSTWQNQTDTAKLRLPRNIYVTDRQGNLYNWNGKNIYGSDGDFPPIVMRGDKIKISVGYFYDNMNGGDETLIMNDRFVGYIARIKNRVPFEIECEDEMWKLKQIKAPNKLFRGSEYTVQKMIEELLKGTGIKVVDGVNGSIQTSIGDFRTQNETVAQVLDRLRKEGNLYCYFRNEELRCSGIVYYPQDRNEVVFEFQENIISDSLEYTRKEDISVAVKAHAEFIENGTGLNNDNTRKTQRKRLEVMVSKDGVLTKSAADNFQGDIISIPVIGATTEEYLIKKAKEYLPKFYYTGFKGSLVTFLQPFVRHGDAAIIRDKVLPERNGTYLIKQVTTTFGLSGGRQTIQLHLRIDQGYTQDQLNAGL